LSSENVGLYYNRQSEYLTISAQVRKLLVAELGAERMEATIGKASLRDAAIGTGVAVDKMLALVGQSPVGIQIAYIAMPSEEKREARRAVHQRLDEIALRLRELSPAG
jgi:hypothetical protein